MKFKAGDKVIMGELEGVLISNRVVEYPLEFVPNGMPVSDGILLTIDGKKHPHHPKPVIKLLERPKRKEKRTVTFYANVYPDGTKFVYESKNRALAGVAAVAEFSTRKVLQEAVPCTGEYEVEVDDVT